MKLLKRKEGNWSYVLNIWKTDRLHGKRGGDFRARAWKSDIDADLLIRIRDKTVWGFALCLRSKIMFYLPFIVRNLGLSHVCLPYSFVRFSLFQSIVVPSLT